MIDWNDNARAAVREFAEYVGQSDKCERYLEHVTTKKTVADAYAWAGGRWKYDGLDVIVFDDKFLYSTEEYTSRKVICTRAEFEAYVKEQEAKQEGEKWTHKWNGRKCIVVFTDDYMSWVKGEGLNKLVPTDSLKPIKPTMSKAEAWDRLNSGEFYNAQYGIDTLNHDYDII